MVNTSPAGFEILMLPVNFQEAAYMQLLFIFYDGCAERLNSTAAKERRIVMNYEELVLHYYAYIRMLGIAKAEKSCRRDFPEQADKIISAAIERLQNEFPRIDVEKSFM